MGINSHTNSHSNEKLILKDHFYARGPTQLYMVYQGHPSRRVFRYVVAIFTR